MSVETRRAVKVISVEYMIDEPGPFGFKAGPIIEFEVVNCTPQEFIEWYRPDQVHNFNYGDGDLGALVYFDAIKIDVEVGQLLEAGFWKHFKCDAETRFLYLEMLVNQTANEVLKELDQMTRNALEKLDLN